MQEEVEHKRKVMVEIDIIVASSLGFTERTALFCVCVLWLKRSVYMKIEIETNVNVCSYCQ